MSKTCKFCKAEFQPPHNRQDFCSFDCRRLNENRRNRMKRGTYDGNPVFKKKGIKTSSLQLKLQLQLLELNILRESIGLEPVKELP